MNEMEPKVTIKDTTCASCEAKDSRKIICPKKNLAIGDWSYRE
jgi:hypothetical protein